MQHNQPEGIKIAVSEEGVTLYMPPIFLETIEDYQDFIIQLDEGVLDSFNHLEAHNNTHGVNVVSEEETTSIFTFEDYLDIIDEIDLEFKQCQKTKLEEK